MSAGICIIAHEPLASALKSCARHIFSATGDTFCDSIAVFDVPCDVDAEQGEAEARRLISNFPANQGVLVFTDVLGATPSNIAHRLLDNPQVRVITGVNLPALTRNARPALPSSPREPREAASPRPAASLPPSRTLPMQTKQLTVLNKLGLHARPCALLAKTAGFFKSSITLTHNNHSVDAKSILGLMTMAVPAGTTLTVTADGPDEDSAIKDITALFDNKFGEQA